MLESQEELQTKALGACNETSRAIIELRHKLEDCEEEGWTLEALNAMFCDAADVLTSVNRTRNVYREMRGHR